MTSIFDKFVSFDLDTVPILQLFFTSLAESSETPNEFDFKFTTDLIETLGNGAES